MNFQAGHTERHVVETLPRPDIGYVSVQMISMQRSPVKILTVWCSMCEGDCCHRFFFFFFFLIFVRVAGVGAVLFCSGNSARYFLIVMDCFKDFTSFWCLQLQIFKDSRCLVSKDNLLCCVY